MRLAENGMKVKTALVDARFLCGDYSLYGGFEKGVESRLLRRKINRFVREKLEENRIRHESYGGSVYLLEPEVKEGEGGLRDLHTARWIARVKLRKKDLDALALNGVISPDDVHNLKESQDCLLRVPNTLYFQTVQHQDQHNY